MTKLFYKEEIFVADRRANCTDLFLEKKSVDKTCIICVYLSHSPASLSLVCRNFSVLCGICTFIILLCQVCCKNNTVEHHLTYTFSMSCHSFAKFVK